MPRLSQRGTKWQVGAGHRSNVGLKGIEMDTLISAIKREQKDAQEQIRAREAFIKRARKRIVLHDEERAAEVSRL